MSKAYFLQLLQSDARFLLLNMGNKEVSHSSVYKKCFLILYINLYWF